MSKTSWAEATVTSKGQIVVPVRLRRRLGLTPGTRVRFVERGDEVLFQPVTADLVQRLDGILKSAMPVGPELLRERARDEKRGKRRLARLGPR